MLNITRLFSTKLAFRYVAFTSDGVFQSARFTLAYQALSGYSESACVLQNSLKALREIILICVLYHNWAFRHKKIRFGSSSRRQWHQFKDYLLNTEIGNFSPGLSRLTDPFFDLTHKGTIPIELGGSHRRPGVADIEAG